MKKLNLKNNLLFFTILLLFTLFFLTNNNLFKKTFFSLSRDYERRMIDQHGFCSRESFGFINYIQKKYNFKNEPRVINFKDVPNNNWPFFRFYKKDEVDYSNLVVLNYTEDLKKKNKLINKFKIKYNNYKIIEKSDNCYLLKSK